MGVREGERNLWTEPGGEPRLIDYVTGATCRCFPCCCKPGDGHKSEGYRRWEQAMELWEASRGRGSIPSAQRD
jgi:hypothetical protein